MATRTMGHLRRTLTEHTAWCARDHRCGVDEHRSPDITADEIGGRAWLTRVCAGDREYVEIRARIPLHSNESVARAQIRLALDVLRDLLAAVAPQHIQLRARTDRQEIGRRTTRTPDR